MRALVVGGSGFIGTRLLTELRERGHEVVNYDLRHSERHGDVTTIGDVRDPEALHRVADVDVLVNLAAEHRDDVRPVSLYDDVNVGGARVVASVAADRGIGHLVFTSSVAVYGLGQHRPTEQAPVAPFNDYGRTKLEAEQVLAQWAGGSAERALTLVRLCVVFGEGNRGNVYNLVRQIASGRFLMVGPGRNVKSMAYVGNVSAFLAEQCERTGSDVRLVNYADGPDLTSRQIVDLVRETLGMPPVGRRALPVPVGMAAGYAADGVARVTGRSLPLSAVRVRKFTADTSVGTVGLAALGFEPPFALRDALARTVRAEFAA